MLSPWNVSFPIPNNWQDFETIVTEALKIRYSNPNFTKNGRPGQKQDGVDIYLHTNDSIIAAQCKLTFKELKREIILSEIDRAKIFSPKISTFIICTTSPRDGHLQEFTRNIACEFQCYIMFWDDIVHSIALEPVIFQSFFGNVYRSDDIRAHDIDTLQTIFSEIDLNLLQQTLEISLPLRMTDSFVYYFEIFESTWKLLTIYFNDEDLNRHVEGFYESWRNIISLTSSIFQPSQHGYIFPMEGDIFRYKQQEIEYNNLCSLLPLMYNSMKEMIKYIQKVYPSVDLANLSSIAATKKVQFNRNLLNTINDDT